MKKPIIVTLALLFFSFPGPSCFGQTPESYYPLKEGMTWVYSITSNKGAARNITITNLPSKELQGKTVTPRKWDFGGGGIRYYFIGKDDDGVYRYAEQKTEAEEPKIITPRVYYLRNPLAKGTSWDISVKMGDEDLKVNVTIENIADKVQVPAGTYKDCIKIKHEGGIPAKEEGGAAVSLTAYEWYAPGVGTVKSMFTIRRTAKGKPADTESTTYRLESFKP